MHGGVHVSIHACTNDYSRCTKCEVHDRVCKNVVRCTEKRVPWFLILEALQVLFLYIFPGSHMNLRDQPWRCRYFGAELTFCSFKLSAKVFLMLGNPFPVPFLCKLNHITVCFIKLAWRSSTKSLFPSRKAVLFLKLIPGVLGRSVNFSII